MTASPDAVSRLRVAIVHERFTELGGSEKVVAELHAVWPGATVHASVLDRSALPAGLAGADIRPSALQRLYRGGRGYGPLLPLLPLAMARLDLGHPDVVLISHHAFASRVPVPDGVPSVAYVHTPARWMWEPAMLANEVGGRAGRAALRAFAATQRRADRAAATRLTAIVANSNHVAARIERYWGRESTVVHPPVDTEWFTPDPGVDRDDFFLLAGRLVPYKQPATAVLAAVAAGVRLVVAGDGRARAATEAAAAGAGAARDQVQFLGAVDDERLRDLFRRCRAVVFPGEEDFGMVPVEAMACSAPVVARGVGGVLDSVLDGRTGTLYADDGPDALAAALRSFDGDRFAPADIRRHAERFSAAAFRGAMASVVDGVVDPDGRRLPCPG